MIHEDIEAAGKSDIGCVREQNEDRYAVATLRPVSGAAGGAAEPPHCVGVGAEEEIERPRLLVVADGVGGAPGGEVASDTAVLALTDHMRRAARAGAWDDADSELLRAAEHAEDSVIELCANFPHLRRMSTTLTAALVHRDHLRVVHAGDSRCYVLRRGEAPLQITRDHTLAQSHLDAGILTEKEAVRSPYSHVLINAIGGGMEGQASLEVADCELQSGDSVLVCSDGLTRHLSDDRMAEIVAEHGSADKACQALVAEARTLGGEDNITAVIALLSRRRGSPPRCSRRSLRASASSSPCSLRPSPGRC